MKVKIAVITGVVVGIAVSLQGYLGYQNDRAWCLFHPVLYCYPVRVDNDEFLIFLGIIFAGLGVALLYGGRVLSREEIAEKIVQSA